MTALADLLARRIARTGPISIAEYMAECLLHPEYGYYTTQTALGAQGDFVTAPEISQMFGELIGLALAQAWLDQGSPNPFVLCELGPGRGTLMADLLRATRSIPGFHDAATICMVEASPVMRKQQLKAVPQAEHFDSVADIPDGPLFLIANEFFDALPVRQFERADQGWCERMIGLTEGALTIGRTPPAPLALLNHRLDDTSAGDLVEHCPALPGLVHEIGRRIVTFGGGAIFIDYGHWAATGNTLQALQDHAKVDPLANPGQADLTVHVDFAEIASAAPCAHTPLTSQGVFLERLGITARAHALAERLEGDALTTHIAAHKRLTHPAEMGDLFKVMALYPDGAAPPPGLTA